MLEVEHLRFSYGKREVLRGVDLRVEPGELVFVLGANGAGKTTLFRCILGLLPGYQGCVRVDGCDVSSLAPRALAKKIAYIPQTSHMIFPYTALFRSGEPGVVTTAPKLPDGTPFPTLYYLTHPALTAAASRLETTGLMREMTERLSQDAELAAAYRRAHESYLAERDAIEPLGTTFSAGGMPDRVKCLHVLIAHSLAKGPGVNPFGDQALSILAADPALAGVLQEGRW